MTDLRDDYKITTMIGRGNFARVHRCMKYDDPDQVVNALKTIDKTNVKRLKRNVNFVLTEIDVLRALDNPYIIKLNEVYESAAYIHLIQPYLCGGELYQRIHSRNQGYTELNAMLVMKNILIALEYMHSKGIVHRDLKPENLILASKDNDYDIRIADFGLAAFMPEDGGLLYTRCGTPGFIAPESIRDEGYDCKSDCYSVGVILYNLLSQKTLF